MRNTAGLRLWLFAANAVGILEFAFAPRRWPLVVWVAIIVLTFAAAFAYMWLERADNRRARSEAATWQARYDAVRDAHDVDDDGHLFEALAAPEWNTVFDLVDQMPPGDRSLKRAIRQVDPSFEE